MYYSITGLWPRKEMSGFGFSIRLFPPWKDMVARSEITQENVDTAIENMGREWLDICGFDGKYDPDNGIDDVMSEVVGVPKKPAGPNARHMYVPGRDLRVEWGEWGPEHISVPGNACGLDYDHHAFGAPLNGAILLPHNVDAWSQVQLLLVTFCWFTNLLVRGEERRMFDEERK